MRRTLSGIVLILLALAGLLGAGAPTTSLAPEASTQPVNAQLNKIRLAASGGQVAIIRIEGLIYDYTLESLRKRCDRAIADGATLIVLELDTNGGFVDSSLEISRYIKALKVPTLAWIHPKAISGGIVIAAACDGIVMSSGAATGDCAPVSWFKDLSPHERAKVLSPLLNDFRNSAVRSGYDATLFHAMCDLGVEAYLVENPATGERRIVNQADYEVMVKGANPDAVTDAARARARAAAAGTAAPTTQPSGGPQVPPLPLEELGGRYLEEVIVPSDVGTWKQVGKPINNGAELLTLDNLRAAEFGLSMATISDEQELQRFLGVTATTRVTLPWAVGVAYWLSQPWMRALLVIVMCVGFYLEFQAPGISIPGILATIALALLLVGPFIVGMAQLWHLIMFTIGLGLLLIELFVTPGFGLTGIVGLIMMFGGLVLAIVPSSRGGMPQPEAWKALEQSILWMLIGLIGTGVAFYVLSRFFEHIPVLSRLVHHNPEPRPAVLGPLPVAGEEVIGHGRIKVGDTGTVTTGLRPTGRAEIGGQIVDVLSLGTWIEPGKRVKVVEAVGNRIVVEEA